MEGAAGGAAESRMGHVVTATTNAALPPMKLGVTASRPLSSCDKHSGEVDLRGLMTIVLNTSPGTQNPSTLLLEEVVTSFSLVPGLLSCRLLIVADGYKVRDKAALKKGMATPAIAAAYEHFLSRVEWLTRSPGSALCGAELLVLEQRHGCAHAFRRGLARVTTPYVMAVQHDRPFVKSVDVCEVVHAMCSPDGASVNCIALPTGLLTTYEARSVSRGLPAAFFRERTREVAGLRLVPLAAFLDSTHVGRCAWFRERVFGAARHAPLPRGAFLEDTMGQVSQWVLWLGCVVAKADKAPLLSCCYFSSLAGTAQRAARWRVCDARLVRHVCALRGGRGAGGARGAL